MTVSVRAEMAAPDMKRGEGERREAAMRRKRYAVIGALFVAGLVTGFYAGFQEAGAIFHGRESDWPPAIALGLLALFLVAVAGGSWVLDGVMDEHERTRTYKAASLGGASFLLAYPAWFFLWKGGFVAEPVHWIMYAFFVLALLVGMAWYRWR